MENIRIWAESELKLVSAVVVSKSVSDLRHIPRETH